MVHKLLKAHYGKSHKLTVGPWSFWEDFKGLWDELSEVSQLAHRMLWWLIFWDPAAPSGPSLAGGSRWLCWLETMAQGSLLSMADTDVAQFWFVSEVSKWMGWRYQRAGSKQDSHLVTGTAWPYIWCPAGVLLHCLKTTVHVFYPKKGTYISHSQAF